MNRLNKKIAIMGAVLFLSLSGILYFIVVQKKEATDWQTIGGIEAGFSQADMESSSGRKTVARDKSSFEEKSSFEDWEKGNDSLEEKRKVYICGSVVNPGVYEVSGDARLDDLLKLCGGASEDADLGDVNLAAAIADGEKIYIRNKEEAKQEKKVLKEEAAKEDGRININTAGREELMTLPGIGAAKAEAILAYREAAPFVSVEDLMKITGIKQGVFSKIKDFIKV